MVAREPSDSIASLDYLLTVKFNDSGYEQLAEILKEAIPYLKKIDEAAKADDKDQIYDQIFDSKLPTQKDVPSPYRLIAIVEEWSGPNGPMEYLDAASTSQREALYDDLYLYLGFAVENFSGATS